MFVVPIAIAFLATAHQSALDSKIDFACPASRAEVVLKKLSDQTHLVLRARPTLASDVLVIQVKQVSLRDLLVKIAKASGAGWSEESDALYLEPSAEIEQKQHHVLVNEYSGRLNAAIQRRLAAPEYVQNWDENRASLFAEETEKIMSAPYSPTGNPAVDGLVGHGPGGRAVTGLLAAIGSDELSDHIPDGRTVYSNSPTSMQVEMPGVQDTLNRFLAEQSEFVNATKAYTAIAPRRGGGVYVSGVDRGDFQLGDPANGIGKTILSVAGAYREDRVKVIMQVADSAGKVLNDGFALLFLEPRPLAKFDPSGDDAPLKFDSLAAELEQTVPPVPNRKGMTMTMQVSSDGKTKTMELHTPTPVSDFRPSPKLLSWMSAPTANEPLRLSAGALLMTASLRRGENLVADLDDRCFRPSLDLAATHPTPSSWLSSTALQRDHDVTEESGWLIVTPRDLMATRKNRVSRSGLGTLLASLRKHRLLTLDDLGEYAREQIPAPIPGGFDYEYLNAINPSAAVNFYDPQKWLMYAFFGALSSGQRQDLASGSSLTLENLSLEAENALRRMVFDSENQTIQTWDKDGKKTEPYFTGRILDWTELLPNGLPEQGAITAQVETQSAAYCLSDSQNLADIRSLNDLAKDEFVNQGSRYKQFSTGITYDRFAPAQQFDYRFKFIFGPGLGTESELHDGSFNDTVAPLPLTQMPTDFQNAIEQEFNELNVAFGRIPQSQNDGHVNP
jgi:hypothetical protein